MDTEQCQRFTALLASRQEIIIPNGAVVTVFRPLSA
jgi:hypothetical protein